MSSATVPLPAFFRTSYLEVAFGLTVVYGAVAWFLPTAWLLVPLGLFVLLIGPGYALGAVMLGQRPRLPWTANFAIVVGLSVIFNILVGLLLLGFDLGLPAQLLAIPSMVVAGLVVLRSTRLPVERSTPSFAAWLKDDLAMRHLSRGYRASAYLLVSLIAVTLAVLVLLAAAQPNEVVGVALGLTGPDGSTASIPTSGAPGQVLEILAGVSNSGTSQGLVLVVQAAFTGVVVANYTAVGWLPPLLLSNGTTSAYPFQLVGGGSTTIPVSFDFAVRGQFTLTFLLEDSQGTPLRTTGVTIGVQ